VLSPASPSPPAASRNAEWQQRSRRHVWHPCTQSIRLEAVPPLPIARGEGVWLIDHEGRRYLDATSSWWVNLFGHAHPAINAALKEQLDTLPHVMLAGCTHAPAVELAERLSALTGGALGHCFYASDGASAVEIALKMSFHSWRNQGRGDKREFICLRHGYHGETLGALGVTDVALFRDTYDPLLMRSHVVMAPDARQGLPGTAAASGGEHAAQVARRAAQVARRAAQDLRALLERRHAHIAALIVEPLVQCAAGMAMHDPAYLRQARALCDQHGVHLVVDEIATGFGRTGTLFAHEQAGIRPDFLCLSKGLTGGTLPLSAVLTTDAVYAAFYDDDVARGFLHSHSYTGNPLACRAALTTLDLFEQEDALARNRATAQALDNLLAPLTTHPRVQHVRRQGMIWAWDITTSLPDFARRYQGHALARGLVLRPIGQTLYFMPPYVLDDEAMQHLAHGALAALEATLAEEMT
jgi:adenosylmethionine-8-amino-7-oxononanoate aminotransferase